MFLFYYPRTGNHQTKPIHTGGELVRREAVRFGSISIFTRRSSPASPRDPVIPHTELHPLSPPPRVKGGSDYAIVKALLHAVFIAQPGIRSRSHGYSSVLRDIIRQRRRLPLPPSLPLSRLPLSPFPFPLPPFRRSTGTSPAAAAAGAGHCAPGSARSGAGTWPCASGRSASRSPSRGPSAPWT